MEKELLTLAIPDISGKPFTRRHHTSSRAVGSADPFYGAAGDEDTPVGHVSYSLTGMQITSANIGASNIAVTPGGVAVAISSVSVGIHGNWSV